MAKKKQPDPDVPQRVPRYPSDLTDAEWSLIAPFLLPTNGPGAPRAAETRAVVDALLYKVRTGCQWRCLPADFPRWSTVYYYWALWGANGAWERIITTLQREVQVSAGRDPEPSMAVLDSHTVTSAEAGGNQSYDGGTTQQRTQEPSDC